MVEACGCSSTTWWRHFGKLIELGYVVPLSHGAGRLANVYGIPGRRGELDRFRAKPGERRGSGPGRRWERADTKKLLGLLCQNDTLADGDSTKTEAGQNGTAAVPKRHSSRARMTRQTGQNDTLPSPLPSSSTSAKPSPLRSRKARALAHDDDGGRPPNLSTDPLADQLSLKLPDSAGPDQVKAVLREYGVDPGRAYNLASNRYVTPAMVRDVLARADRYDKENPGAYIGNLIDDAIAKAREAEREHDGPGGTRTLTPLAGPRILSPLRLPIPPQARVTASIVDALRFPLVLAAVIFSPNSPPADSGRRSTDLLPTPIGAGGGESSAHRSIAYKSQATQPQPSAMTLRRQVVHITCIIKVLCGSGSPVRHLAFKRSCQKSDDT